MNISAFNPLFIPITLGEYSLSNHRIDVWQFPLTLNVDALKSLLPQEELDRAARFHFPIHRTRHIAAHTILRFILSRYLNQPGNNLNFAYNAHGKPELKDQYLHFNLSHSRDLALLAVGKHHPLGIDLEYFSARPYEGIGQHIFSELENNALTTLPQSLKSLGFFHLWTQKEALTKACGLGLSYPTKQLTLPLLPPVHQSVYDSLHQTTWQLHSFMPAIACCAAICYHPTISEIRFHALSDLSIL
ncbi:4'-phosphopantetheinyl transferase family protein [Legionella impletisoli]|uniref:Phosphopantetheine-protein transferase n=1 Tax=Legionella impletisoli TaxID=343510 RepID=A0A917N9B1_9GAMM|nr:4'-phosphopantetheinyl transferase superfamily protein [Legionella impletisoli]GGI80202.1 phosphopantetheine-protein transferase [Legionella impletisoli]